MSARTKGWGLVVLIAGLAPLGTVTGSPDGGCDMKKLEPAYFCKKDNVVLGKKELVSKKSYYECVPCRELTARSGKCKSCDKKLTKKVSDKGVCPRCYVKPVEVEACVKTGYACPKCGHTTGKPAKCEGCKATGKKVQVRAVIAYRCPDCTTTSRTPGYCKAEECKSKGKALTKACSQSGTAPHAVPAKPEKQPKGSRKKK